MKSFFKFGLGSTEHIIPFTAIDRIAVFGQKIQIFVAGETLYFDTSDIDIEVGTYLDWLDATAPAEKRSVTAGVRFIGGGD